MTKNEKIQAIKDAFAELSKQRAIIETAEEAIKVQQGILKELIPDNETLGDIKHTVFESSTVSYAKYVDFLMTLIPKTKQEQAELMKQQFTKSNIQHRYTEQTAKA